MTPIKKFYLTYGSFFGTHEELVWDNGRLLYRWGYHVPENEQVIDTDKEQWQEFLAVIQSVVPDWKGYYDGMVCDGLEWSVEIESNSLSLSSAGNHDFPEHYDTFLHHVRTILRCPAFADGHSQNS